jgi:hypothetical protein
MRTDWAFGAILNDRQAAREADGDPGSGVFSKLWLACRDPPMAPVVVHGAIVLIDAAVGKEGVIPEASACAAPGRDVNQHVIGSLAPYFGRYDYINPDNETHALATASGLGPAGDDFTATWHRQR